MLKSKITFLVLSLLLSSQVALAQEAEKKSALEQEFTLDPVIVTASRYETRELETPASVEVITQEEIKKIGAKNVQETLKQSLGTTYSTYGPGGASMSSMTSDITIRGVKDGTLVLVNGRPVNSRGLHYLEKFKTDVVERIEVVRGGGAVMYGSDAMGGVINIITKKGVRDNSVYYDMGNFGQINSGASFSVDKLNISYNYSEMGKVTDVSINDWKSVIDKNPTKIYNGNNFDGSRSQSMALSYDFNDKLSLFYSYDKQNTYWNYKFIQGTQGGNSLVGLSRYKRAYENRQNIAQLNYNDKHFKASLYYNDLSLNTNGIDYRSSAGAVLTNPQWTTSADERNRNMGLDVQHDWKSGKSKMLVGLNGQYEYYRKNKESEALHRYNYAIYSSLDYQFTERTKAIVSMRYNWQAANPDAGSGNLSKLTPQVQVQQKIGKDDYLYASAGLSYKMPTLNQQFAPANATVIGNSDIKPQSGENYELGWKRNKGSHGYRVALFNYYIKNNISAKDLGSNQWQYVNEDRKNTGLELEYTFSGKKGLSYNLGGSIGNPKTKNGELNGNRANVWERAFDRYQLTGGVSYEKDNWTFSFSANYLFGRTHLPSSKSSISPENIKPALYTTLKVNYKIDKKQELYLRMENLFNRKDIVNYGVSEYYATPFNFIVGYNVKF